MKQLLLMALVVSVLTATPVQGQDATPEAIEDRVTETVDLEQKTQTNLDDWSQERQELDVRFRTANANIAYLEERLVRQEERAAALDDKVEEYERRLTESARLSAVIQDTMDFVLGRLTEVVGQDLPFLPEEREARLANLRVVMASPDLAPAEKLRFLLEAMLIEAQYGETVEVQPGTIEVEGKPIHADILRIGRLAMFWRSPDGSRVGTWDPAGDAWMELPGKYNRVISRSMEMASRVRPVELVSLPLGRINR
jgi:uncharacterized coiled-coil protein SlyX